MALTVVPITFAEARAYVAQHHRHHPPPVGHKFSVGVAKDGEIVGVAIASRPTARHLDDGWTLEVTRLATDGTRNACSFLYGAVRRIGKAMGYRRFVTFTMPEEGGASLRASGWTCTGDTPGRSWSVPSRPRVDKHPLQTKLRWEAT